MDESRGTQTKHYATLDGMRGFAALSVVLFHLGHWLHAPWLATNSHLAVDFFFCLSGFVLPVAYDRRLLTTMSSAKFLQIRLVRLFPLTILATCVSALYVLFRAHVSASGAVSSSELFIATFLALLNIPFLFASRDIGGPQVFPLNGPQFSLFLELVVNFFWAATRKYLGVWRTAAVFLVCFLCLPFVGLGGDNAATFWTGFPRVGASFFAGVLVYSVERNLSPNLNLAPAFMILMSVMTAAFLYTGTLPLFVHLLFIAALFPFLILTGARTHLTGLSRSIALSAGALSYPIYALHYPIFCWLNGFYQFISKRPQNIFVEGPFLFIGIITISYVALKSFDEPVRGMLSGSMPLRKVHREKLLKKNLDGAAMTADVKDKKSL